MKTPHILVVEDDRQIRDLVAQFLELNGLRVSVATDGREMDRILKDQSISLIVLDRMLPGEDGLTICRRLRATSNIPIILLTALSDDIERIIGLEMGADDYVGKPFNPRELLARIRAVLRRHTGEPQPASKAVRGYAFDGWQLDIQARRLLDPTGSRVTLTSAEFDLLQVFCEQAGRVLSREEIIDLTQGRENGSSGRSVDILVSRLRQKIEKDPRDPVILLTVRSSGYSFAPDVSEL
ncbi:response regulator [Paradevosia shaoguanensis]|uniref:Regulatory protein VirG n=1 Tax=Paradevosia shaoguanensis TaxID=1335043 RepID=A0AA41QNR0_9HYPH|nr:response regulator [Paradevosia shaoguanensis]KFL26710.1 transcriptional regulator [Devosia sp. 17-2-E-8]QMV01173.1 response regulator [Devosia sp. D6-9]CDP50159.1 two-component response regulator [Devosia sp. DBB001]MCF1743516.1 response regulator [Paradevosia shaoguanensis]MCI0127999.1 response regulator [Paradevosia shaoguanensis]